MGSVRFPVFSNKYPDMWTIIDEEDYERVRQYHWSLSPDDGGVFYAYSRLDSKHPHYRVTGMHRFLMHPPDGFVVDHINRDGLDNRRCNLRIVTHKQNAHNTQGNKNGTSRYKGVYFNSRDGKWHVVIRAGKLKDIGAFASEEDAARAYDVVAREEYGDYAYLNFPDNLPPPPEIVFTAPRIHARYSNAYRGVRKQGNRWRAFVNADGKKIFLGGYATEAEALIARTAAMTVLEQLGKGTV